MKTTIEFDFDGEHGIDDESRFKMMMTAQDLYFAVRQYSDWLRSLYKHKSIETIATEQARQKLYEFLGDKNINLDDLM